VRPPEGLRRASDGLGERVSDAVPLAGEPRDVHPERGIPEDAILLEVDGTSTYTELAATSRILDERGLGRVLMVSDGYHSARLLAIADEVGLDGAVSPTDTGYSASSLLRETAAMSVGRLVGFRRLDALS